MKKIAPGICNLGAGRKAHWHRWYSPSPPPGGSPSEEGGDEGHTYWGSEGKAEARNRNNVELILSIFGHAGFPSYGGVGWGGSVLFGLYWFGFLL